MLFVKLQEEGGDVQEIEMEVEEDADAEREDLKAREARKKVHLYRYFLFTFVLVLGNIPEIPVYRGMESIPYPLLQIPKYRIRNSS